MKTMHATTVRRAKPLMLTWRDLLSAGGPLKPPGRCGFHGGKGRKTRGEITRRTIREQT